MLVHHYTKVLNYNHKPTNGGTQKMKKTIAILLALLLCLTSAGAWAEETDLKVTGTGPTAFCGR